MECAQPTPGDGYPVLLIVDDYPENLISMRALLQRQDWRVMTAASGLEALNLLLEHVQQAYAGGQVAQDEAPGEFAQYLEWRSEVVLDEDAAGARLYWQEHLQDAEVELSSPWLAYRKASAEAAAEAAKEALEAEEAAKNAEAPE